MNMHDIDRQIMDSLASVEGMNVFADGVLIHPGGTLVENVHVTVDDEVTELDQINDTGAALSLLRAEVGRPPRYSAVHAGGRWYVMNGADPSLDESMVHVVCQRSRLESLTDEQQQAWSEREQ